MRPGSLIPILRMIANGWILLNQREKRFATVIAVLSFVASACELAALSAAVPFIGMLIDPASLNHLGGLRDPVMQLARMVDLPLHIFLGFVVAAALIVAFALRIGVHVLLEKFSVRFTNRLVRRTIEDCLGASYSWLGRQNGATLAQRITTDTASVGQALYPVVLELIYTLFILLIGITAIIATAPTESLVVILAICAVGASILLILNPIAARYSAIQRETMIDATRLAVETFAGRKVVKALNTEAYFADLFARVFAQTTQARMYMNIVNKLIPASTLALGQVGLIMLAIVLVASDLDSQTLLTQLTFIVVIMTRILPAASTLAGGLNKLTKIEPFFRAFLSLRAEYSRPENQDAIPSNAKSDVGELHAWQQLAVNKVAFSYPGIDAPGVHDLNLTIERGRTYGLAGPSGAGKSTMIDLLTGLLAPDAGQISIDGYQLDSVLRPKWLSTTGYVPQDPHILDDTLRRNVAFALPDSEVDDDRVRDALAQAQLKEILDSMPDGLDTLLGDGGSRLSGGQRQRIAIARTLYRGASLIILDEATNALDAVTEESISKTVLEIPGITSLVVAHRLSLLRNCDAIILMDAGRVVAIGPYDELQRTSALFRSLAPEEWSPDNSSTAQRA